MKDHADIARAISPNYTACRECHGADLRGTDYRRDSDGDGLSDWIEYALGLDPLLRTSLLPQQLFESASGTSYLTVRVFRGPLLPADMSTSIQVSGDLIHWTPGAVITNSAGELKARDTTPANAAPVRLIRVEAVRTTPGP